MGNSQSSSGSQSQRPSLQRSPTNRFRAIRDQYTSLEQVQDALRREGLESSNLIVAVDFTKSNEWTGKHSFGGRSLHELGHTPNPYEEAMMIIGKTLAGFDDDQLIPAYGFGDASCQDSRVFSFNPGDAPCQGLESVVWRYRQLAPAVRLAGPTSFAPAIQRACQVVAESGGRFHILLLIADGQVTRSSDLPPNQPSPQEAATIAALVAASKLPLAVVMVGVGDGPWDMMKHFDDALPQRAFDNFQFVNFTELMASCGSDVRKREAQFALRALMEIPDQYKIIQRLGLLGRRVEIPATPQPLPPPAIPGQPPILGHTQQQQPFYPHQQQQQQYGYPSIAGMPMPAAAGFGVAAAVPAPSATAAAAVAAPGWGLGQAGSRRFTGSSVSGQQQWVPQQQQQSIQNQQQPAAAAAAAADPLSNPMFMCPITQDVMTEPVIAADGYTYEKQAIQDWLSRRDRSPMTNQPLTSKELIPNHTLRSAIMEAREAAAAAAGGSSSSTARRQRGSSR